MTKNISQLAIIVFLITLFFIRFFEDESDWISIVNYFCIVVAVIDLYLKMRSKLPTQHGIHYVTVVFVLVLLGLVIFGALIFTQTIKINDKWVDLLTIIVLLISLPSDFYCKLLKQLIKER